MPLVFNDTHRWQEGNEGRREGRYDEGGRRSVRREVVLMYRKIMECRVSAGRTFKGTDSGYEEDETVSG